MGGSEDSAAGSRVRVAETGTYVREILPVIDSTVGGARERAAASSRRCVCVFVGVG